MSQPASIFLRVLAGNPAETNKIVKKETLSREKSRQGSCGIIVSHDNPPAKRFESSLQFFRSCVVIRIQHPAHYRFPDTEAARQFRLTYADFTNRQ